MFVSFCGKLHFMHCEKKTTSRFHVNVYLGEILRLQFCIMIHLSLFVSYQDLLSGPGTMMAEKAISFQM